MKKNFKFWFMLLVAIFSLSIIAACGDTSSADGKDSEKSSEEGNSDEKDKEEEAEEVTIKWAHQWGEEHFRDGIGKALAEKFPNVTIEVQEAGTDFPEDLEKLIAADKSPDVVSMGLVTHANFLEDLGLAYDMDELVEKSGFDLDRLEPSIVKYARSQDPKMEERLLIMPNGRPTWSLHYNKDVFDTLGVSYPTDGMTWAEVTDLAKDLTRQMNGIQYRGLDLDVAYDAFTQFSQELVDPETDEVIITESEALKRYLGMIGEVVSIPGNYPEDEPGSLLQNWGAEFGTGEVAMAPAATNHGWLAEDNIDIVTYPVWEGYEGLNPAPNTGGYAITAPSEHKEVVMEMITYLLSDEYQMKASKEGTASVLVKPEINEAFGADKPEFEGKNLESLFKNSYAPGPEKVSDYGVGIWTTPIDYVNSGKDLNEFLRVFQEKGEESVRSQMETE